jgi:hypothetical protein
MQRSRAGDAPFCRRPGAAVTRAFLRKPSAQAAERGVSQTEHEQGTGAGPSTLPIWLATRTS